MTKTIEQIREWVRTTWTCNALLYFGDDSGRSFGAGMDRESAERITEANIPTIATNIQLWNPTSSGYWKLDIR